MRGLLGVLATVALASRAAAQPASGPPAGQDRVHYEGAYKAMLRGEFETAAAGFTTASALTNDPELRGAALELARLAGELASRKATLAYAAGGGSSGTALPGAPTDGGAVPVSEDDSPSGGRASFVVTTTLASLYTGVVLVDLLDAEDVRTGTLLVMASTAAGVAGSIYGTRGRTMTGGMADAWSLGLFAGAGNALLLSGPAGLYEAATNASEKVQTTVLLSSWGAATGGLLIADRYRPTRAQVGVTSTFGLMGIGSTLLALAMVRPGGLDGDAFLTITALGLDAGIGAGIGFARTLDWSHSRSRYVALSAFLGALAGGGTSLLLFADTNNDQAGRAAAAITFAGLWGGFGLGMYLTRDMAPDYRFRVGGAASAPTAMLAPTRIEDGPGLALVGMF